MTTLVPYGDRPGSVKLNKENFAQLMKSMDELDNINNMPEGLDPSVWERFCATRRAKVENEYKVYNFILNSILSVLIGNNTPVSIFRKTKVLLLGSS